MGEPFTLRVLHEFDAPGQVNNLDVIRDADNFAFRIARQNNDNAIVLKKYAPGQSGPVDTWLISTAGGQWQSKADGLALSWYKGPQDGRASLEIWAGVPNAARSRQSDQYAALLNVLAYSDEWAHSLTATEGLSTSGGGGGEPVDYERIEAIVAFQLDQKLPPHTQRIVDNMKPKAKAALQEEGVVTLTNIREVLYQFLMDRVYQTFADNALGFWPWLEAKVAGEAEGTEEGSTNEPTS